MEDELVEAMINFQYLELSLRVAVQKIESLIQDRVKDVISYPVQTAKIEKFPLGKLAEVYYQYTQDAYFKREVDQIIESRNRLAHALFVKKHVGLFNQDEDSDTILSKVRNDGSRASDLALHVDVQMQFFYYDVVEKRWVGRLPPGP